MKYLDTKEQVIDIQLTSYGKHLLSKGEFRPHFYEFFDDDVIYDLASTGENNENQNYIQDRIFDTPRLEPQVNFAGVETEISNNIKFIRQNVILEDQTSVSIQNQADRDLSLKSSIGTVSPESLYGPAWNVRVLNGALTGSVVYLSGTTAVAKIPQLNAQDVLFKRQIKTGGNTSTNIFRELENVEAANDTGLLSSVFPDGSYLDVDEDFLFLSFEELNTESDNDNFEVELYEVVSGSRSGEERLIPMFFFQKPYEIQNDILVVKEGEMEDIPLLNPSFADYFLTIRADQELPNDKICLLPKEDRPFDVICEEGTNINNLYDEITEPEEKC